MGNWITTIAESLNLKTKDKNLLCGTVDGYDVTVVTAQNALVYVNFYGDDLLKSQIATEFKKAATKRLTKVKVTQFGFTAAVSGMTYNSIAKAIINGINKAISLLKANNIPGNTVCPLCGKETTNTHSVINGVLTTVCVKCENEITQAFAQQEAEYQAQANNYFKGIFGALIGALVGAIGWVLIYILGYLSAITAIVGVMLSDFLYVKFGGKSNKMKLVIISIINVLALVIACLGMYTYIGDGLAAQTNSTLTGLAYIFADKELTDGFIYDMILNIVFVTVGVIAIIVNIYKKNKNSHSTITK